MGAAEFPGQDELSVLLDERQLAFNIDHLSRNLLPEFMSLIGRCGAILMSEQSTEFIYSAAALGIKKFIAPGVAAGNEHEDPSVGEALDHLEECLRLELAEFRGIVKRRHDGFDVDFPEKLTFYQSYRAGTVINRLAEKAGMIWDKLENGATMRLRTSDKYYLATMAENSIVGLACILGDDNGFVIDQGLRISVEAMHTYLVSRPSHLKLRLIDTTRKYIIENGNIVGIPTFN